MKKIIKNIIRKWYIYLVVVVASTVSVMILTNYINTPRDEEVISLFVGECSLGQNKLKTVLNKNKPTYLREISIHSTIYYSSNFDYFYTAFGKSNSDLIILPESVCYLEPIIYYYSTLDEDYVLSEIPDASFFSDTETGKSYGIKIRNKGDTKNNIITFSDDTHDEDYYAFFYKKSLHAGKNNGSNFPTSMDFVKIITNYAEE